MRSYSYLTGASVVVISVAPNHSPEPRPTAPAGAGCLSRSQTNPQSRPRRTCVGPALAPSRARRGEHLVARNQTRRHRNSVQRSAVEERDLVIVDVAVIPGRALGTRHTL